MNSQKFMIFGPCSLESEKQIELVAAELNKYDQKLIRCALFKPRTHPDSFQGLGEEGISIAKKLGQKGFQLVTEVCSREQFEMVAGLVHVVQIGTRNMQNYELLKDIGKIQAKWKLNNYVMLKMGFCATYDEWLASALYLERHGVAHDKIILCERGTRNSSNPEGVTLDLQIALKAKFESDYLVIADPSHGTRHSDYVLPMAEAIMNLPLDGIMIEAHPFPKQSISDANQAIGLDQLGTFLKKWNQSARKPQLISDSGNLTGLQLDS